MANTRLIVFNFFSTIFTNAFNEFLYKYEKELKQYLEGDEKPPSSFFQKEAGFPSAYKNFSLKVDKKEITDEAYYATLAAASKVPASEIKALFNEKDKTILKAIVTFIREKLKPTYTIATISNIEKAFLQDFLDYKVDKNPVGDLFSAVLTNSEKERFPEPVPDIQYFNDLKKQFNCNYNEILYVSAEPADKGKLKELEHQKIAVLFFEAKELKQEQLIKQLQELLKSPEETEHVSISPPVSPPSCKR